MFKPKLEYNRYFSILYLISFVLTAYVYGFDVYWGYAYLVHFVIGSFGLAFGYHKLIIHRAIETFKSIKYLSALVALMSNTGSAITWATSHYLHHSFPDTENDPHSPLDYKYRVLLGFYNTDAILANQKKVFASVRHVAKDKFLVHLHKSYYLYLFSFFLICYSIGGVKGLLFFGIVPSGLSFYSIVLTNYFNHGKIGYRNFDTQDLSRNVWFLFFLTFGENWHNNHHRYPSAPTTRIKWWEIDASEFYCKIFDRNNYQWLIFKTNKLFKRRNSTDYVY